jgi:hypothetical protein
VFEKLGRVHAIGFETPCKHLCHFEKTLSRWFQSLDWQYTNSETYVHFLKMLLCRVWWRRLNLAVDFGVTLCVWVFSSSTGMYSSWCVVQAFLNDLPGRRPRMKWENGILFEVKSSYKWQVHFSCNSSSGSVFQYSLDSQGSTLYGEIKCKFSWTVCQLFMDF